MTKGEALSLARTALDVRRAQWLAASQGTIPDQDELIEASQEEALVFFDLYDQALTILSADVTPG